ncbi:hypothetical protein ONS95_004458 [Cadophora gregata]|uniref:uncharacterized protein n=1 Tax=Cadophora gregata TaxID=51156 RepID=UPI0026DDBFD8|nr:uncharacterized protein ONS95_004458 [Cadophora gregata]KAK0105143.1 hypothetical protein ONS96_004545 [Cadophora gregata f. sp. sojae]KAK0105947.1 hypothetical protein ONS95_004458 [Cadophora gregata]
MDLSIPPMPAAWARKEYYIFNDSFYTEVPGQSQFTSFRRLPVDLRLRIWEECLTSSRLINLELYQDHDPDTAEALYSTHNSLGKTVSSYSYRVVFQDDDFWTSKSRHALLWVDREANQIFHAHYRVHFPLGLNKNDKIQNLLYNPEYDTLHIKLRAGTPAAALVAFMHDTVAYDPNGVGIAHLAMSLPTEMAFSSPSRDQAPETSVVQLLVRSLQTVHLVISLNGDSRNMLGQMSFPQAQIHQNRSLPLSGPLLQMASRGFSVLDQDPRPIKSDLSHVAVGTDPRRCLYLWTKFVFSCLGPQYEQLLSGLDVRYLLSISPAPGRSDYPPVSGRKGFVDFVRVLDYRWATWMMKFNLPPWGKRLSEEENMLLDKGTRDRGPLQPVAGFWLFSIETFGDIEEFRNNVVREEECVGSDQWRYKMVQDLSLFKPKLGVFDFS